MSLNIKNPETHRLAQELAALTGETLTAAVTQAIEEQLKRVKREKGGSLSERLLAIGRNAAARMKEPYKSMDHGELLYDEKGLPK